MLNNYYGCLNLHNNSLSKLIEVTDLFAIIKAFDISFIAYSLSSFLYLTFHT